MLAIQSLPLNHPFPPTHRNPPHTPLHQKPSTRSRPRPQHLESLTHHRHRPSPAALAPCFKPHFHVVSGVPPSPPFLIPAGIALSNSPPSREANKADDGHHHLPFADKRANTVLYSSIGRPGDRSKGKVCRYMNGVWCIYIVAADSVFVLRLRLPRDAGRGCDKRREGGWASRQLTNNQIESKPLRLTGPGPKAKSEKGRNAEVPMYVTTVADF